jgi:hypothetical protein
MAQPGHVVCICRMRSLSSNGWWRQTQTHSSQHGRKLQETDAEIARLATLAQAVMDKCEGTVSFRMISVDTTGARAWLSERALELRSALMQWVADTWHTDNANTVDELEKIVAHMRMVSRGLRCMYCWNGRCICIRGL